MNGVKPDADMAAPARGGKREPIEALIVAGPTCSGKSALALALAERLGGSVINADSMQIYAELRILTARPSPAEEAMVPHLLYGVRPAALPGSAAWWLAQAKGAIEAVRASGRLPILCGGTGLYFKALREGLAEVPHPGEAARRQARALLAELGPAGLHARLAEVDPRTAAELRPADSQRVARAWEVWSGTGRGLSDWRADASPRHPRRFAAILLDPDRSVLRAAIARRTAAMLDAGALDEVRALLALGLDPALPAMRAHGVPELGGFLCGQLSLPEATTRMSLVTGQYTKRQATWFHHHCLAAKQDSHTINARFADMQQLSNQESDELDYFIMKLVDADG